MKEFIAVVIVVAVLAVVTFAGHPQWQQMLFPPKPAPMASAEFYAPVTRFGAAGVCVVTGLRTYKLSRSNAWHVKLPEGNKNYVTIGIAGKVTSLDCSKGIKLEKESNPVLLTPGALGVYSEENDRTTLELTVDSSAPPFMTLVARTTAPYEYAEDITPLVVIFHMVPDNEVSK